MHYDQNDWLASNGEEIKDWEAIAKHWMLNSKKADERKKRSTKRSFDDPLKVSNSKNYGEPL
ncbi:hypothetical protein ACFSYG_00015 [Leeuwenhoekiella polynyae]|uniref:hypothetical protein n=1 Tax=Leeuwenhoekiella polynyae TaxID=1550906 RepID=UPI000FFEB0E4|nr:hypothetical protein [Leeuwenhoekiella polynyae]